MQVPVLVLGLQRPLVVHEGRCRLTPAEVQSPLAEQEEYTCEVPVQARRTRAHKQRRTVARCQRKVYMKPETDETRMDEG